MPKTYILYPKVLKNESAARWHYFSEINKLQWNHYHQKRMTVWEDYKDLIQRLTWEVLE